jgi:hypothetical protein
MTSKASKAIALATYYASLLQKVESFGSASDVEQWALDVENELAGVLHAFNDINGNTEGDA